MATRQYVGARYVPIFDGDWDNTKDYEPLVIVSYQGNSYTSRTFIPHGTAITDETYWALTGNYNAQVEAYRQEVLALSDKFDKIAYQITPSGDTTGATDISNINSALHEYKNVLLTEGTYYINAPIEVSSGYILRGDSITKTKVNVVGDINGIVGRSGESVDHIHISDFRLTGNNSKIGINLVYPYTEPYLSARYSLFSNLWIEKFNKGCDISVIWDTEFNNCRFVDNNTSIELGNSCNNVTFLNCKFYGKDVNPYTSIGVVSTSRSNTENYNYTFISCDFEKLSKGVDMSATVGSQFYGCYFEKMKDCFVLDNCPATEISGGNANLIEILARVNRSDSAPFYAGTTNIHDMKVSIVPSDTDKGIVVVSDDVGRVYMRNISILNTGTGNVYYTNKDSTKYRTGVDSRASYITTSGRLRYSSDALSIEFNGVAPSEQIKLQRFYMTVESTVTTLNTVAYQIIDGDNNVVGEVSLVAGTHNSGDIIIIEPTLTSVFDMDKNSFTVKPSDDPGVDISFTVKATAYVGEFRTPKSFVAPVLL